MLHREWQRALGILIASLGICANLIAAEPAANAPVKVYGEWRIQVKPDKGADYDRLIESEGLPLFRAAGGRMVGWWKSLVGNLYEHVTIWEYDEMAAFEKAIGYLGNEPKFAAFVAKRDPFLSGEENRFLKLSAKAIPPTLNESAPFVIHELQRVPLKRQREYLDYLEREGLNVLKGHGFRPVGPWTCAVGKWSEVTLLFRFDSLAERERLIAKFMASAEGQQYAARIGEFADEVTTRLLMPASFAKVMPVASGTDTSQILRHLERLTPAAFAVGFDDRFRSANCGFFAAPNGSTLVDLPRGVEVASFVKEVERLTGQPVFRLILTRIEAGDAKIIRELVGARVKEIVLTRGMLNQLKNSKDHEFGVPVRVVETSQNIGDVTFPVEFIPEDGTASSASAVVALPTERVLFGGPLVLHGPRCKLVGSDTLEWIAALKRLEKDFFDKVVPGFGTWGSSSLIVRQRRYLEEMRSQVGYVIALGRPPEVLEKQVRISPDFQVWMPYDSPVAEDLLYVYRELTVPNAPFSGHEPVKDDQMPHALVLIGDAPHEPQHLERGLTPAFQAAGIAPHFTVDVRAISAENLARVPLLVVLRDGLMRPTDDPKDNNTWITKEQERAVTEFVAQGGGFLNLHNSLGLYPADGAYLKLAAGRYIGHGPLERFRVEPVDPNHPITRGISAYSVADEQHTPVVELNRVKQLFRSMSDSGVEGVAGWVYEPGNGRLCHLANGHTRDALEHPTYQRVLRNALLWCLKRDSAIGQ